ncbi:hypothetical protein ACSAZL_08270 [Methanosarcina sp. T3]
MGDTPGFAPGSQEIGEIYKNVNIREGSGSVAGPEFEHQKRCD